MFGRYTNAVGAIAVLILLLVLAILLNGVIHGI